MTAPTVSIVIPLHNCESTIRRSLRSVSSQTYQDFELVLVDNNCTDKTFDIIEKELSPLFDNLNIVKCVKPGIVPALNTGLRAASGKWIARQDGDDYWYPEKLEKQMSFLDENPDVGILGTQIRCLDEDGNVEKMGTFGKEVVYPTSNEDIKGALMYGQNPICHPSVIFHHDVMNLVGGYEQCFPLAEDLHFWCKAFPHFRFANLNEVLVDYTQKRSENYDARIPLVIGDMYYSLYKLAGIIEGERQTKIYDWQINSNTHGKPGLR